MGMSGRPGYLMLERIQSPCGETNEQLGLLFPVNMSRMLFEESEKNLLLVVALCCFLYYT